MKIAIDIRALMEGKTTGVEVYLTNLLRALFKIDAQNEYVLFANSWQNVQLPEFKESNVRLVVTRYPNKLFNIMQRLGFPKIDRLTGKVDLFFSPHWRAIALPKNLPLVVTFHDLVHEVAPQFFTWWRRFWHRFMDYRGAAKRANMIVAVSENTKQDLIELYGVKPEKIEVIHPGVQPVAKLNSIGESKFLFFGTFEPRKNIECVIAAYKEYYQKSRVKRSLIVAGSSGWKTSLQISQQLKDHIKIEQNVNERRKQELFSNAFAFLFPSFYEGFGFPVLEAATAGVPVITAYNSSLAEVTEGFALFANPFRPSQFASAMLELEKDAALYAQLQSRGLEKAKLFDWDQTAMLSLRVFDSVLKSSQV